VTTPTATTTHRVVLVREWDAQHTGSGCCGRLGGCNDELGDPSTFRHNRDEMEAMGAVYRALKRELRDAVEVVVVDPRNTAWLVPSVYRDARRSGRTRGEAVREVCRAVSYTSVVVDGHVLFRGHVPDPDTAVDAILAELAGSTAA
jgi:hypothetical protein